MDGPAPVPPSSASPPRGEERGSGGNASAGSGGGAGEAPFPLLVLRWFAVLAVVYGTWQAGNRMGRPRRRIEGGDGSSIAAAPFGGRGAGEALVGRERVGVERRHVDLAPAAAVDRALKEAGTDPASVIPSASGEGLAAAAGRAGGENIAAMALSDPSGGSSVVVIRGRGIGGGGPRFQSPIPDAREVFRVEEPGSGRLLLLLETTRDPSAAAAEIREALRARGFREVADAGPEIGRALGERSAALAFARDGAFLGAALEPGGGRTRVVLWGSGVR